MLSSLTRIFQPSTTSLASQRPSSRQREHDPLATAEAGHGDDDATRRSNDQRSSLEVHSDSTPLLTRKQSSQFASSITTTAVDSQYPAPPHVLWKTPGIHIQREDGEYSPTRSVSGASMLNTPTTPGWQSAQPMGRSASSPSLLLTGLSNGNGVPHVHRPSSLGRQSNRSLRLPVDSFYASEESDAESEPSARNGQILPKQLSPIHEQQVPFPPHRKLSLDSVPRTPDSTRTFDRLSGQNAFINRPLKRSLSQTSTSTHRSNISAATPPVIPPLDLRPNFQSAMGVPHGPQSPALQIPVPRKSRLPLPSLPTVVGSPRQTNKVSVIYEDGASASARSSSFVTAPSLNSPTGEQRFSFGHNVYLDPSSFASDSGKEGPELDTDTDADETEETDVTHRASRLPAGLYDTDMLAPMEGGFSRPHSGATVSVSVSARPSNPTPPSTHSFSRTGSLTAPRISMRTRSSAGESFVDNRWLKGLSFGSERFVSPPREKRHRRRADTMSYACILFWFGFIAPWCWLIGGWLLTSDGDVPEEERKSILPLWNRIRKGKMRRRERSKRDTAGTGDTAVERPLVNAEEKRRADPELAIPDRVAAEERLKGKLWYPLIAPSVESLAPSTRSSGSTKKLKRCIPRNQRADPWIRRCKIAAAVSGLLLFAAIIIVIVFIAGVRR